MYILEEIMKVTKSTVIGDIMDFDNNAAQVFFGYGMFCLGCPHARGAAIEAACAAHGVDADALGADLNKYFEEKANA